MPLTRVKGESYPYLSNRSVVVAGVPRGFSAIRRQDWRDPAPEAGATDDILTTKAGPNATTVIYAADGAKASDLMPGYGPNAGSRNVVVTVTHATAVVAVSGVITGKDIYGRTLQEAWSVAAGGTSQTFVGKKAFKSVTSVSITAAGDASTDTITVGRGAKLGLDVLSNGPKPILEVVNYVAVTTGALEPNDSSSGHATDKTSDPRGTYVPAAAPDGTNTYVIWYLSDAPEWSDIVVPAY